MSYPNSPGGYPPPDPNQPGYQQQPPANPGYSPQPPAQYGYQQQPTGQPGYPGQPGQPGQPGMVSGPPMQQPGQPGMVSGPPMQQPGYPGDINLGVMGTATPPKRRSPVMIAALAVIALVLVGGGAWAAASYFGGDGPSAATRLPASAKAFAAVNLDVSGSQLSNLASLAEKFPDLAAKGDPQEMVNDLLMKIDEEEVKPAENLTDWVGLSAAVSYWTDGSDRPYAIISIASRDDAQAKEGLTALQESAGGSETFGFVVRDGYATVAGGEEAAQAAAEAADAEAEKTPLADSEAFAEAGSWLGDDQVITMWANLDAGLEEYTEMLGQGMMGGGALPMDLLSEEAGKLSGTLAIGATATEYGIEIKSRTFGSQEFKPGSTDMVDKFGQLPKGEISAMATLPTDLQSSVGPLLEGMNSEEGLGMDVAGVLDALSGSTVGLSLSNVQAGAEFQVSVETTSPDAASTLSQLGETAGGEVATQTDGNTVTATSSGFSPSGTLSESTYYGDAVADAPSDGVSFAAYIDLAAVIPPDEEVSAFKAFSVLQGAEDGQPMGVYRIFLG